MNSSHPNLQAIVIVCFAYIAFSVADLFSKILGQDYNVHQILSITGFIGTTFAGGWIIKDYGWRALVPPTRRGWHIIRALCVAVIPISIIKALQHMPLADFYGISFCAPFIILILSYFFLKEAVGLWRWIAVTIGFSGVLLIAGPQYEQFGVGLVYAAVSAVFVALSVITVRKIGPGQPRPYYIFYPFLATFLINTIALQFIGPHAVPPLADAWKFIVLMTSVISGHLAFAIGHARASEAGVTAPFLYTQIIWGVLFGWLVFGDIPALTTWIGLIIVVGAGLFSIWREWRLMHSIRSAPGSLPPV